MWNELSQARLPKGTEGVALNRNRIRMGLYTLVTAAASNTSLGLTADVYEIFA